MIDLTPLDVRKKKGDFRRGLRGYDAAVVDEFLDLVAERMEELVRENATMRERLNHLADAVTSYQERDRAMNEALVSAQQLREDVRAQAGRDAEVVLREARTEADRIRADAAAQAVFAAESTKRVHLQRARYVRSFRSFVERQFGEIEQEEDRLRDLLRADVEHAPRAESLGAVPEPTAFENVPLHERGSGRAVPPRSGPAGAPPRGMSDAPRNATSPAALPALHTYEPSTD